MPFDFRPHFERALPYEQFLSAHATPEQCDRWKGMYDSITFTDTQLSMLAGFRRKMPMLCLSGPWCGDCVHGCPIFQRISEVRPDLFDLRFINRPQKFDPAANDLDTALANELSVLGAPRVPMLVFFSEEMFEAARYGERTLATYRDKVAKMQGPSCSTGLFGPSDDLQAAIIAEWLTIFERVQLMLITSPRLMKLHGEV